MASKPQQQKASGVACIIDGIVAKRVQTFGASVDQTREQVNELANTGVVEYISDSPSVSIQIDTNDVGSTDTIALLTDKLITYTEDDESDGPRGGLYRMFIKNASSNAAYREIDETDMLNGYCSILATVNEGGTSAARTMWINQAAVTAVNLSYDVNGNAAENYTLSADNKTWFLNSLGNVRCYKPIFNQIVYTSTGLGFTALDSAVPDGSTVVAIGINNNILRSRAVAGVTGNATFASDRDGTGGPSVQSGIFYATSVSLSTPWASTSSTSQDRCWIIYKPAGTSWEATSAATNPGWELEASAGALGAIRRGQIKAYLYNTNSPSQDTYSKAGKALRLQTVSIDVALGEDQLFELGTDGFYGISKQSPVPITVTLTANDSDLQYFAMLTSTASSDTNVKSLTASDFNGYNALRLEIYKDKNQTTLLKTISITKMYVQNENFNVSVGDNATHEMTFTTDNVSITGSGTSITGGWYTTN